jgi:hypothetical protein
MKFDHPPDGEADAITFATADPGPDYFSPIPEASAEDRELPTRSMPGSAEPAIGAGREIRIQPSALTLDEARLLREVPLCDSSFALPTEDDPLEVFDDRIFRAFDFGTIIDKTKRVWAHALGLLLIKIHASGRPRKFQPMARGASASPRSLAEQYWQ